MLNNLIPIDELLLQVRFKGEVHNMKEFIQPGQFHVLKVIDELGAEKYPVTPEDLWDFVCTRVAYPLDRFGRTNEYHRLNAYAYRSYFVPGMGWNIISRVHQEVHSEWFDFPYEILTRNPMMADCDGTSILLCSLLRSIGADAYVAIGGVSSTPSLLSHAWVVTNCMGEWQVWETTTDERGLALPECNEFYEPLCYFNESQILADNLLYSELAKLDYIPNMGDLMVPFGMEYNDIGKQIVLNSIIKEYETCPIY